LCEYSVQPLSKRVSSALPCGAIDSIRRPSSARWRRCRRGRAKNTDVSGSPTIARASASAARRISGPSGIARSKAPDQDDRDRRRHHPAQQQVAPHREVEAAAEAEFPAACSGFIRQPTNRATSSAHIGIMTLEVA
jgi:hypothetical protein